MFGPRSAFPDLPNGAISVSVLVALLHAVFYWMVSFPVCFIRLRAPTLDLSDCSAILEMVDGGPDILLVPLGSWNFGRVGGTSRVVPVVQLV